eukprot:TRINITY_DN1839_c0_g1_i3.p1 TRINITY_DN1839_c0_g1~~TRINITY_DN1839_c0_g1_i3.p1  ORF type:complete len:187 (+),score=52.95 TRINITY_DN1839_c0_g1_i3:696-1256(+)
MKNEGFVGNIENYYHYHNSLINVVLNTGMGIPITLSIVFKMIADRVGLKQNVKFLNFPSHFLLRLDISDKEVMFVDAFNNKILTFEDAKDLVQNNWSEEMIQPIDLLKVWNRQTTNLVFIFQREDFSLFVDALDLFYTIAESEDEKLEISLLQLNSCFSINNYQKAKKIFNRECVANKLSKDQLMN